MRRQPTDQQTSLWQELCPAKHRSTLLVRLNPASLIETQSCSLSKLPSSSWQRWPSIHKVSSRWLVSTERVFYVEVAIVLLITVWFSTLSDSLAETQAKNTANSLRKLETESMAKKIVMKVKGESRREERQVISTPSTQFRRGDMILLEKGDMSR